MKWVLWHERLTIERSERGVQHVAIDFLLSRATTAARPARSLARSFPFSPSRHSQETYPEPKTQLPTVPVTDGFLLTRVAIKKKKKRHQGTCCDLNSDAPYHNRRSTLIHLSDRAFPVSTRDFGSRHGISGFDTGFWVSTWDSGSRHGMSGFTYSGGRSYRCRPIFFPKFIKTH
jgi:hypothetical protein